MNTLNAFFYHSNKIIFPAWGLTIADMINFIDLGFLDLLGQDLQQVFSFLGVIYLAIQIPFKVMKWNHNRKMDKVDLQIKMDKQKRNELEQD
jgi:hypothetical protein